MKVNTQDKDCRNTENNCFKMWHAPYSNRWQQAENHSQLKNGIFTLLLICFMSNVLGQTADRTYLRHSHNYSTTYSYEITEITIHSDSTFTQKSWFVFNKKEWKTYKKSEPEVSNGKITRNGKFYTLTEYRNGNKTDFDWTVKISDKRLNFYYPSKKGKLRKSAKYKRI